MIKKTLIKVGIGLLAIGGIAEIIPNDSTDFTKCGGISEQVMDTRRNEFRVKFRACDEWLVIRGDDLKNDSAPSRKSTLIEKTGLNGTVDYDKDGNINVTFQPQ